MRKFLLLLVSILSMLPLPAQIVATKEENGKYGFVDAKGNWVVRPQYYNASWYESSEYGTFNETSFEKQGAIDKWGKVVVPCKYYWKVEYSSKDHYYDVINKVNGKFKHGRCNTEGKEIIPPIYDAITLFEGNYYVSIENGNSILKGCVDKKGKIIVPCKYENVWHYDDGDMYGISLTVNGEMLNGLYDKNGKELVTCKYDMVYLSALHYNMIYAKKGKYEALLTPDGKKE